jgi:hypothetical protein
MYHFLTVSMMPTLTMEQDDAAADTVAGDDQGPTADAPRELPTILLCWGYHRSSWIEPFERLKSEFRFAYIFYRNREEEEQCYTDEPVLYWQDYSNAQEILDEVRPDKIIFMSLTSGYPIALNMAARQRGIATYILQHGIHSSYADEIAAKAQTKVLRKESSFPDRVVKSSSTGFLARTMRAGDFPAIPRMALFFLLMHRWGDFVACRYARFPQRMPTGYICFTERNAVIYRELDHARPDQIHVIGIPEYDGFFTTARFGDCIDEAPYYLLIDQPLAENSWGTPSVSREEMIRFYRKLIAYCKNQNARLKIKLHPESYNCEWLPEDEGAEWIRDTDIFHLIRGATACFGMFSTLVLPAAVLKPLCLFDAKPSSMVNDLSQRGLALVLDFFTFEPSDIQFRQIKKTSVEFTRFVQDYLYKMDARSGDRLAEVLRQ